MATEALLWSTHGPADAVAHGYLADGMMLSLLGSSSPAVLRSWFSRLSAGGRVVDEMQARPWGATDGQVVDRYGLHWLIGFGGDDDRPAHGEPDE